MTMSMTKVQGRFRPRKRQSLQKRFLLAYSTGFRVPKTYGANKFQFFEIPLDGPLIYCKDGTARW